MFLEARRVGARAMSIPLDKLDRVRLLFPPAPRLELGETPKREVVACDNPGSEHDHDKVLRYAHRHRGRWRQTAWGRRGHSAW